MEKQALITEIIELQRKIDRARRQYELDAWMEMPLTVAQLKSLVFISSQGCCNPGKLAGALNVTPTNITGIIDRLVKAGMVTRAENPENRRMQLLKATAKGESLIAKLTEKRIGYLSEVLSRMNEEDLSSLSLSFVSLLKAIDDGKN